MNKEKIGKFIATLRREKKLTQEELANILFVDRGTVSKWERGVYVPIPEMLVKISEVFDVSVNELIYGERKTETNEIEINNVPAEIIKDHKKRLKKLSAISALIIILLGFSFLFYYFITTYKSIKVYRINSNEEYIIDEGIMITSREKVYMKIGEIKSNKQAKTIRMFYLDEKKERELYHFSSDSITYSNSKVWVYTFKENNLFDYSDLNTIIKNLYLEITFDNQESKIIHLSVTQDFTNKAFFELSKNVKEKEEENASKDIPSYIIEKFEYLPDDKMYVRNRIGEKYEVEESYFVDEKIYVVNEKEGEITNQFEYHIKNKTITYVKINKKIDEETFAFWMENSECIYGNCESTLINHFQENYLKNILN